MKRATHENFLRSGFLLRRTLRHATHYARPLLVGLLMFGLLAQSMLPLTVLATAVRRNAKPRSSTIPGKAAPARAAKARRAQTNSLAVTSVSGASYEPYVAPDAIVSAFGTSLATKAEGALSIPLPTTLAGTSVVVRDSLGMERTAQLFYVSPLQVNYLIPAQTAAGEAIVTVTAGNGVISQGIVQVSVAAPAMFSATANGSGAPAADLVRLRNGQQTLEPVAELDASSNEIRPKRIDPGPDGDRLFLQLYLTGLRGVPDPNNDGNARENVRVLLGDTEIVPDYAGRQPSFVGLDQLNVEIPRTLAGRGRINLIVTINGFISSNLAEIDLGAIAGTSPPNITGFGGANVTAGQSVTINGAGFSVTANQNVVRIGKLEALVTAASPNQLTVIVPFGAETAKVTVRTPQGDTTSSANLTICTTLSGMIETTSRQPLAGATVKVIGTALATTTNAEGAFLLPDVPAGASAIEIDGSTVPPAAAYPKIRLRTTIVAGRDNQLVRPVALQYIKGASVSISPAGLVGEQSVTVALDQSTSPKAEAQIAETANVVFDLPSGTRITFPDGTNGGSLTLTQLENNRAPVGLPRGIASSAIIQVAPFGGSFSQGGKLTFPNREGYAANAQIKLYRLEQALTNNSLGNFVESGIATVSPDGKTIETQAGVITESGCYFVAGTRTVQTLAGRVVDNQGNAVRNVFVSTAGQAALSDGTGGFQLRLLPASLGDKVTIDATWQRPTGRVERLQREFTIPTTVSSTGFFRLTPDLTFASETSNRAPVILAPTSLHVAAGQTTDIDVIVSDQDVNQTVQLALSGASLATLSNVSGNTYRLRVAPGAAEAGSFTLTLTATDSAGAVTTQTIALTVTAPPPKITDFTPKNGIVGSTVILTGTSLKTALGNPTVTFAGANGTRLQTFVSAATATQVSVTVPNGAVTGIIDLTTTLGRTATNGTFTVDPSQSFTLTLENGSATALQGGTATYILRLNSNTPNFSQLTKLSLTGAPTGAMVKFDPEQITAGATSTLSIVTPGNLAAGSYNFTINGTAMIDGVEQTRTAGASLTLQAATQTTLSGRVLSTKNVPLPGVTVSLDGKSATTDAAGSFLLSGISAGPDRPVMVNGKTANVPNTTYPIINEPVMIVANQANVVPYTFFLPAIDTVNQVTINPTQTTVVTTPEAPGTSITIPANTGLRNRDGSPVTQVSITCVEIDRAPAPLPANFGTSILFTAQPGGARPADSTARLPVTFPNLSGANPGTSVPLLAFNHDMAVWQSAGTGTVTADGKMVKSDPGSGLRDFSWFAPDVNTDDPPDKCPEGTCCPGQGPGGSTPNRVELSNGRKVEVETDIAIGGARGGLELTRTYISTRVSSQAIEGLPFGFGATHNYDIRLTGTFVVNGAGRVFIPGEVEGRLYSYDRTESGVLVFTSTATTSRLSDVVRKLPDGSYEYRKGGGMIMRFNSSGRMTAMVDRNGNVTTLTYTGNTLTRVTDPLQRSLVFEYTGNRITKVTDPLGRIWKYAYNTLAGHLSDMTDPLGNTTRYTYDNFRLTSIVDARGFLKKKLTYDTVGRVLKQEFADGSAETFEYSTSGRIVTSTKWKDALGRVKTYRFNAAGYVISEIDELGQPAEFQRNLTTNLLIEAKGPCGCSEAKNSYDARGQITTSFDRLGQKSEYSYDPNFTFVTSSKDPLGRVTRMTYDTKGNRLSMTDALGRITNYSYDGFGQLLSIRDPLGHVTRFAYDANGYVSSVTDALNNVTNFENDAIGRLKKITDAESRNTAIAYDANDRITMVTDPAGVITKYEYDENDNRTAIINAQNKKWSFVYDGKNRLQRTTDPLNQATNYRYNSEDEMTAMISPTGRTVRYEYDSRGQRSKVIDPLKGEIKFTYDNRKNLTTLTDQRGNTTTFVYDELYRLIAQRDPLGRETKFSYDAVGNLLQKVDRLNRPTQIAYDALNRPATITYVDAAVTYNFDEAGRLMKINDTVSGAIDWTYDDANRMLSEKTPQGLVSYSYNKANQRATMTAADRPVVNYGYDSAGRLSTIKQSAETFTWAYDELSRMKSLSRPNSVTTSYEYDAANKLSRILHANAISGFALEDLKYTYNPDNEIEAIASLASGTLLPTAKAAAAADSANRVSRFGQAGYTFDEEGQTRTKTDNQGTTIYDWDARGRLNKVTLPNGQAVNYGYDAMGRRNGRTAGGLTTNYLYDEQDIALDQGAGGNAIDYLNGPGMDNLLRQSSTGPGSLYFLQDHLNSTIALANVNGVLVERPQYDATGISAGSSLTRYEYTGREKDNITGDIFYRARWYDPTLGNFLSEDPIGWAGGLNLYSYVGRNSINNRDPRGLFPGTTVPGDYPLGEPAMPNEIDTMSQEPPEPFGQCGCRGSFEFNPVKAAAGAVTFGRGFAMTSAGAAGTATIPVIGQIGGPVAAGIGAMGMSSGMRQIKEAFSECFGDAEYQNFYGLAPFGGMVNDSTKIDKTFGSAAPPRPPLPVHTLPPPRNPSSNPYRPR